MSQPLVKVRPGDLITADFVNNLIDTIVALDARVQSLENGATGPGRVPVILATVPPNQIQAGAQIQVIGQNFTPASDVITFAGFTIDNSALDPSSGPGVLVFTTPTVTFTGSSKDVFVTVRNNAGVASWPMKVTSSPQVAHGTSSFATDSAVPNPGTISRPGNYTFGSLFVSSADAPEFYKFTVVISDVSGVMSAQTWTNNVKLQDGSGNDLLAAGPVPIQPFIPFALRLKVTIPSGPTAGPSDAASIAIRATASSNPGQLSKLSDALPVQVGQTTAQSDGSVVFTNTTQTSVPAGSANRVRRVTDGNTEYVEFPYKGTNTAAELGTIELTLTFKKDGTADYKIDPPGGPWLFDNTVGWGPQSSPIKHDGETEIIHIKLKLNQAAPADSTQHPELSALKLTATRTNPSDGTKTVSFTTVKIRGYTP